MSTSTECARAEVLAGALALGEATDAERDAYRRHVATCAPCLTANGGEREIERVVAVVARARDAERWDPDVSGTLWARANRRRRFGWAFGGGLAAAALALSVGIHALAVSGLGPLRIASSGDATASRGTGAFHVTVERARTPGQSRPARGTGAATPRLVVVHNVVTLERPPAVAAATPIVPRPVRSLVAPPAAQRREQPPVRTSPPSLSNSSIVAMAPSQRDERSIAALRTAATAAPAEHRAESIAMTPPVTVVHDLALLGGESAIVPHPSSIAYDEGAEGTTAFEITVDERGAPTRCTITKSSGYLVLDDAVCKAAMRAHFIPKTVNGRAVPGVYHDAFTFRSKDD